MRILLINDAITEQYALQHELARAFHDCELEQALSSDEAIAVLECQPVDLIIQDIIRPGMDGRQFLLWLHRRGPQPPPPVIISSLLDPTEYAELLEMPGVWAVSPGGPREELLPLVAERLGLERQG